MINARINYEVEFKYDVLRGNPTHDEVLEILEKTFPTLNAGHFTRIIGKDDADHFTTGDDGDMLIEDYHESWTTLLRVHFWSWNGRRAG